MYQKGISLVGGLLILLVVSALGFTSYYIYSTTYKDDGNSTTDQIDSANDATIEQTPAEENSSGSTIPEGWTMYENADPKFSFAYPKDWGEVVAGEPSYGSEKQAGLRQGFTFSYNTVPFKFALNSKTFGGIGTDQALPMYSGYESRGSNYVLFRQDNLSETISTGDNVVMLGRVGLLVQEKRRFTEYDGSVTGSDLTYLIVNIEDDTYDALNFLTADEIGSTENKEILKELAGTVDVSIEN